MRTKIKIVAGILILTLLGCGKKSPCFKGQGKIISQEFTISDFSEITVHDNMNLILEQGPERVIVEAGENMMSYIKFRQNNETLELNNDNKCEFLRNHKSEVNIYISSPNIKKITYEGIGNISSVDTLRFLNFLFESYEGMGDVDLTLVSDNIYIKEHSGSANINLRGTTNFGYYYLRTTGWFDMKAMKAKEAHVVQLGYGDISVFAENKLMIDRDSYGDVIYLGDPELEIILDKGSGKIKKSN